MTALPQIIGLCGLGRAGKDTVGGMLADHAGYRRVALADPVRADLYTLNPMVSASCTLRQLVDAVGWEEAKMQPEVRRLLATYATDMARAGFGDHCWIRRMLDEHPTMGHNRPGDRVVVTDVRFDNEATAIRALDGAVVRVVRPGAGLTGDAAAHVSEAGVSDRLVDMTIDNGGTLDDLWLSVRVMVDLTLPLLRSGVAR